MRLTLGLSLCALAMVACKAPVPPAAVERGPAQPVAVPAPTPTAATSPDAAPAGDYTVRGIVRGLPANATPGSDRAITVLHQAIPNFRDRDGAVVGMMSMPMPFTLAAGTSLAGIAVGDKVEFSFVVLWTAANPTHIVAIRKLPADTEIKFGE